MNCPWINKDYLSYLSNFGVLANCCEKRIAKNRNLSTREKFFFERACIISYSKRFSV